MHAYVCKISKPPGATKPLQIKEQNIVFFIEPLMNAASFQTSENGKKWHLKFFIGSDFQQELVVDIEDSEEESKTKPLGRAFWQNNGGSSENNARCREAASKFLRGSNSLSLDQGRELTADRTLITDRDGFAYFSEDPDQFLRIILCQSLAIAYTQVLYQCIAQLTKHVRDGATEKTLALYESILRFNAAEYFSLPVRLDRHELFAAWHVLSEHHKLSLLSQELTQQLSDVATLLRAKRDQEHVQQEKTKERQENLLRDCAAKEAQLHKELLDKKDKRRNFGLALIGVSLTAISLVQLTPRQFRENALAWKALWSDSGTAQASTVFESSARSKAQSNTDSTPKK